MAGFNLVEIAIAMVIIGILLTGGLMTLQAQTENQQVRDAQKFLEDARDALTGFAASHPAADGRPYLPCPDKTAGGGPGTPNDGVEDRFPVGAGGACATLEGNLPWVTLGLSTNTDPWGNRLRYQVAPAFSNSVAGMALASTGSMTILDTSGGATLAATAPAIILSHGKNGRGAVNSAGIQIPTAGAGPDELANTDGNTIFVSHPKTDTGAPGGSFDDQLIWLTPNILFNRMLQAGRLP